MTPVPSTFRHKIQAIIAEHVRAVNNSDIRALSKLASSLSSWRFPGATADADTASHDEWKEDTAGGSLVQAANNLFKQVEQINVIPTRTIIDEDQKCAAIEWALRYRAARSCRGAGVAPVRQVLGGVTLDICTPKPTARTQSISHNLEAWRCYYDGGRAHAVVPSLEFADLDPALSVWRPSEASIAMEASLDPAGSVAPVVSRADIISLLKREASLWGAAEAGDAMRAEFNSIFEPDCVLINPWTVELSRESRWEGFKAFGEWFLSETCRL